MLGNPVLFSKTEETSSVEPLKPVALKAGDEGGYGEKHIQDIIDQCPDVLAVREFVPEARGLVSLGREIPVDLGGKTGYIDNLLVTDTGNLVIVETKLWRNPQALREVIAQVLHYGMALMSLSIPLLESCIRKGDSKSANRLSQDESISQRMRERIGPDTASTSFDGLLDQQTRSGEMLFLIVGDGIHQSVERFASWLGSFKALPFQLGLVELRFFSAPCMGTVVVPRTLLKTKEIARHVVSVKMSGETASQVKVEMEDIVLEESGGSVTSTTPFRQSAPMDEDTLLARARAEASPKAARFVADLIELLKQEQFDIRQTPSELVFGIRGSNVGDFVSLLNLSAIRLYPGQAAALFDFVSPEALGRHRRALNRLGSFFTPEAVTHIVRNSNKGCLAPRYDALTGTPQEVVSEFSRFRAEVLRGLRPEGTR